MNDLLGTFTGIVLILVCVVTVTSILLFIAGVTKEDLQESSDPVIKDAGSDYDIDKPLPVVDEKPVELIPVEVIKPKAKRVYKKKPK